MHKRMTARTCARASMRACARVSLGFNVQGLREEPLSRAARNRTAPPSLPAKEEPPESLEEAEWRERRRSKVERASKKQSRESLEEAEWRERRRSRVER
eukprot:21203-Pleurochrysis_carterae.AAC.1